MFFVRLLFSKRLSDQKKMGNCASGGQVSVEEKQRSKDIDLALKKDRKYIDHEIKILLLGAGESGKSTYASFLSFSLSLNYLR